jgi:hypothetical protein
MTSATAVTLDCFAWYIDASSANPPVVQGDTIGRAVAAVTAANTTTIVAAPASGDLRRVKGINIRNKHASTSTDVTMQLDVSATDYELFKVTLRAGETLQWREELGWYVIPASDIVRRKLLGTTFNTSSTTPAEVTGLTLTTGLGTFAFKYYLVCQSAATTTGQKISVNHSGTVTSFVAWLYWVTAATTASDDVPDQDHVAAPGGVMSAYTARAKSTGGWGVTTDIDTANADVLYIVDGITTVTVDGSIQLYYGGEAAASTSVMAGSGLLLDKIA